MTASRFSIVASWLILLVAMAASLAPLIPRVPPASPDETAFSIDNALVQIDRIAQEPRPIGSPGNERGRDEIAAQLRALGLEPEFQAFKVRNYFSPRGELIELMNVLARIPGTASTGAVALMGHYDTVLDTLGANDDAGAVAILLEAARAILAGPPLRNDVILLFTDGEEPVPRFGSSAFAGSHPWFSDIGFVINLEAIGSSGPSIVIDMNGPGRWLIDQYARGTPYPVAFSFVTAITELIGGSNTDFSTFRDDGVSGFDLAYLTGSPIYHTMADSPENVGARSLHQQGANALALARHIGNLDLGLAREDAEAVFFTIGRYLVIRYPSSWTLPLMLLTAGVLIATAWRQRGWLRMLLSFGTTIAIAAVSAVAAVGIWTLIVGWRSSMGIFEGYLYLAGFVALNAGIGAVVARVTRRRTGTGSDAIGCVTVWWLLGLFLAIAVPGMSYLFAWPALVGGLALQGRSPEKARLGWRLARWALVSVTVLVLLVPAVDLFYQFAQPRPGNLDSQILAVIAIPAMLLALVIELLRAFRVRPLRNRTL
ncbi:M28 family peptidase [Candidatus Bipolaricaulota bacterium]|nr:M28 family peptidase [Candidatus Bipolaricaulota bacterium]